MSFQISLYCVLWLCYFIFFVLLSTHTNSSVEDRDWGTSPSAVLVNTVYSNLIFIDFDFHKTFALLEIFISYESENSPMQLPLKPNFTTSILLVYYISVA